MRSSGRLIIILSMLYAGIILALGSWWLYLIVKYGEKIAGITGDESGSRILTMVKWEGGTFLTLLILLSASLLILYIKDQKKTRGLQAFYASMTHELKTPLASIKLQSEVLQEEAESLKNDLKNTKISKVVGRLISDTMKMETQMDKILQLSRLEGGGHFNLYPINLIETINNTLKKSGHPLAITFTNDGRDSPDSPDTEDDQTLAANTITIKGDELALELIFKNLFENTINHAKSAQVHISIKQGPGDISLTYEDGGTFNGDPQKLGQLFYKHNSKKGTGIGLYLIKKLAEAMNGAFSITSQPSMAIHLTFKKDQVIS